MPLARPSSGDAIAGVSVALVAIPQSLAYAELAGLPPQYGLFASALPALLAAAFVSSPYLQTGPVVLTSLLTFGALSTITEPGSGDYIERAALLAILVGVFRVLLGLARLGRVAYLLSEPVLMGFTTGAAVLIVAAQVPKVFDVAGDGGGVLADAIGALARPSEWNWSAIGFAAVATAVILVGSKLHRLFPGVLVAVAAGVVASAGLGYSGSVVGELGGGFVSLGIDFRWSAAADLVIPAAVIALVGFAESASIARTFARTDRMAWDPNREMISQGVANLAAGVSGAFPVGGSFSRSSLNRLAGATSAWSGAVTGAFVLVALPLMSLIADLPRAILGVIVIVAVMRLVDVKGLFEIASQSPAQAVVGVGTLAATLVMSPRVERGVLIGISLAVAVHLYRELSVSAVADRVGDTLTVSPQGVLWFATVPQIDRLIRTELAGQPDLTAVVVDMGGVGRLDYSGAASLGRILAELVSAGVEVVIVNVPPGAARSVRVHLSGYNRPNPSTGRR